MFHAKIDQRLSVFGIDDFEVFHCIPPVRVPQIRGEDGQRILRGPSPSPNVPQRVDGKGMAQTVGPRMPERHVSDNPFGTMDSDPFDCPVKIFAGHMFGGDGPRFDRQKWDVIRLCADKCVSHGQKTVEKGDHDFGDRNQAVLVD